MLVKPDIAQAQLTADAEEAGIAVPEGIPGIPGEDGDMLEPREVGEAVKITRFHGSVLLDSKRLTPDAGKVAEEVLSHLSGLVGAKVDISLEIQVDVSEGIPEDVVRIVQENCNTLKFTSHGFEEGNDYLL